MDKSILVVAAHPDDEAIGCCGTLIKHINNGDSVQIIYMTNGESSRVSDNQKQIEVNVAERNQAAISFNNSLGAKPPIFLDFPDNKMDSIPLLDVVQAIEKALSNQAFDMVYTHHLGDLNIDHRITAQAVLTCFRPMADCPVSTILSFEVNSSTEWQFDKSQAFQPNYFVDISDLTQQKLALLKCYDDEMRNFPHPRSYQAIDNLSAVRGSVIGKNNAEAFVLLRHCQ